jgi:hypothetical protein
VKKEILVTIYQVSMRLLFEETTKECFSPAEARIRKLRAWIEQAQSARLRGNLESFPNQYDKAEELITFYTFAPLVLSPNRQGLTNQILRLAGINQSVDGEVSVCLERQFPSPALCSLHLLTLLFVSVV